MPKENNLPRVPVSRKPEGNGENNPCLVEFFNIDRAETIAFHGRRLCLSDVHYEVTTPSYDAALALVVVMLYTDERGPMNVIRITDPLVRPMPMDERWWRRGVRFYDEIVSSSVMPCSPEVWVEGKPLRRLGQIWDDGQ